MRYTDCELFDIQPELWELWLDDNLTPRQFFEHCIDRLKYLIEKSVQDKDWMNTEENHLRNYRLKSIRFYERKLGL